MIIEQEPLARVKLMFGIHGQNGIAETGNIAQEVRVFFKSGQRNVYFMELAGGDFEGFQKVKYDRTRPLLASAFSVFHKEELSPTEAVRRLFELSANRLGNPTDNPMEANAIFRLWEFNMLDSLNEDTVGIDIEEESPTPEEATILFEKHLQRSQVEVDARKAASKGNLQTVLDCTNASLNLTADMGLERHTRDIDKVVRLVDTAIAGNEPVNIFFYRGGLHFALSLELQEVLSKYGSLTDLTACGMDIGLIAPLELPIRRLQLAQGKEISQDELLQAALANFARYSLSLTHQTEEQIFTKLRRVLKFTESWEIRELIEKEAKRFGVENAVSQLFASKLW